MNDADSAAAVAAAPAVRHSALADPRSLAPARRAAAAAASVSNAALSGNSHTAAASELSV